MFELLNVLVPEKLHCVVLSFHRVHVVNGPPGIDGRLGHWDPSLGSDIVKWNVGDSSG